MTVTLDPDRIDLGAVIRPGDHVLWSQGTGEPTTLIEALVAQRHAIGPVSVFVGACFSETLRPEHADRIRMTGLGGIGTARKLTKVGVLGIVPAHVSQIPRYIEAGLIGCDVVFVQVSPVGPDGKHSFGLINDFVQSAIAKARVVVAEVNAQIPWTYGHGALAPERIDYRLEVDRPPIEVPSQPIGALERAIGKHAARFIEDGACLQVGIGAIPDAILQGLEGRRDLGIHSGMVGDSVLELIEQGIVTNARKPFDKGVSITGALIGTRRLYDYAHRNPAILLCPSAYTHGEAVLSRIDRLVAINSALEIDLTGQVNAEQTGEDYVGGIGGQADYVRAGHRSPGGRSIHVLPATARGGSVSRIRATLSGPVSVTRSDVDVVVTEFGAAELRGQTLAERARRLTAIAHPDFREELQRAAHELFRRGF